MATDYTPTGTTAQSPAPAPTLDSPAVIRLPTFPADGGSITLYYQAAKALAEQGELLRVEEKWARGRVFRDGFVVDADANIWSTHTGSAVSSSLVGRAYALTTGQSLVSPDIGVGGVGNEDFRIRGRVLLPGADATSAVAIGFLGTGSGSSRVIKLVNNALTDWRAHVDGVTSAPSNVVVPATSGAYQNFEIRRRGGVLKFFIDGTEIHSVADSSAIVAPIKATFTNTGAARIAAGFELATAPTDV